MNIIKKFMAIMSSQIKGVAIKLPTIQKSHKIKDDNQSIHNGVVNENSVYRRIKTKRKAQADYLKQG